MPLSNPHEFELVRTRSEGICPFISASESNRSYGFYTLTERWNGARFIQVFVFNPHTMARAKTYKVSRAENSTNEFRLLPLVK